jgi:hypothetical protein
VVLNNDLIISRSLWVGWALLGFSEDEIIQKAQKTNGDQIMKDTV